MAGGVEGAEEVGKDGEEKTGSGDGKRQAFGGTPSSLDPGVVKFEPGMAAGSNEVHSQNDGQGPSFGAGGKFGPTGSTLTRAGSDESADAAINTVGGKQRRREWCKARGA